MTRNIKYHIIVLSQIQIEYKIEQILEKNFVRIVRQKSDKSLSIFLKHNKTMISAVIKYLGLLTVRMTRLSLGPAVYRALGPSTRKSCTTSHKAANQ